MNINTGNIMKNIEASTGVNANKVVLDTENRKLTINTAVQNTDGQIVGEINSAEIQEKKRVGMIECETCRNRKYQDQSEDPGVSFKAGGHIDPSASRAVVMSHEMEHVSNENSKAKSEGRQVISQSVSLETSMCPECGRVYISGGQTTTTTKTDGENRSAQNNQPKVAGKILNVKV